MKKYISLHQLILFQRIVCFEERDRHHKRHEHNLYRLLLILEAFSKNIFPICKFFDFNKDNTICKKNPFNKDGFNETKI